jgi:tRNA 2-thiouridine synthesizing protein E
MIMNDATQDFVRPGYETQPIPGFPHAPSDWSREQAEEVAQTEGLELTEAHWAVVRALQELCTQNAEPALNARDLHDALDEHFHAEGGIKYLYQLFPEGPLAQGCLLAGVEPPAGTRDQGMGSAV